MIRMCIAVGVLASCSAFVSQASIIYSNFGPGQSFLEDAGAVISESVDLRPSFDFTSATAQNLTEVDFVASIGSIGAVNQVTVSLFSDSEGHPGTLLAAQGFTNAMGLLGGAANDPPDPPTIISWVLSSPQALVPGQSYWITLDAAAPGDVTWNYNNQLQWGYSEFESGNWVATSNTLGALQILGQSQDSSVAPEPGTALLSGFGILAVIGTCLRRMTKFA